MTDSQYLGLCAAVLIAPSMGKTFSLWIGGAILLTKFVLDFIKALS